MPIITKETQVKLDDLPGFVKHLSKDFMIFDIETTGFSRQNAIIYMIGCIYKKNDCYNYSNVFAKTPAGEEDLIRYFFTLIKDFNGLIHFNGNQFDIPFLLARAKKYQIKDTISDLESIDLYELLRPYRKHLDYPDLKLNTIQEHMGYRRRDTSTGGDLIPIYKAYTKKPYKPYYELLVLHNKEDVEGMIYLLPLIDLLLLIDQLIAKANFKFLNIEDKTDKLKISYSLPHIVAANFKLTYQKTSLEFFSGKDLAYLTLPIYKESKKLFFENYRDYMYVADKGQVIHKSIASFMPTSKRVQAKKSNCFITYSGLFIPAWDIDNLGQPFKDSFRAKDYYAVFDSKLDASFFEDQLIGFLKHSSSL